MPTKLIPEDLAVFGGAPAFEEPLHVGRPNLGDRARFLRRVEAALDRVWLTNNGPLVREFEARLATYLQVPHVVAVCNATVGLEILARALELSGEVIVPSFTFPATAHALEWLGIEPVFCDIDPDTHNLDPALVEALISDRTTAILGVHLWGQACAPGQLAEIAARRGIRLVYDSAHAFGARYGGRPIGSLGDAEVFSFHATKLFNTLEGGAVTTRDAELADRLRLLRNFGYAGLDQVVSVGTNGKMNEVSAAMGLTVLETFDSVLAATRAVYLAYRDGLAGFPGLHLLELDPAHNNCQYIVVEVDPAEAGLSRDALVDVLRAENVLARRYFTPGVHRMAPYDSRCHAPLPETERLAECVMVLPGGAQNRPYVAEVCGLLAAVLAQAGEIERRMGANRAEGALFTKP